MLLVTAVLAVAHAAAPLAVAKTPVAGRGAARECLDVRIGSPQLRRQPPKPVFSASRILDLEFGTLLRQRRQPPRTLELRLYTPRGYLYQVLRVGLEDSRHSAAHGHRPSATLPVAGTLITTGSLYGRWRVEPQLDGEACGPAQRFVINP